MLCPKCNREFPQEMNFCRYCGTPLVEKHAEERPTQVQVPHNRKKLWIFVGALAGVLLLAVLGIYFISAPTKPDADLALSTEETETEATLSDAPAAQPIPAEPALQSEAEAVVVPEEAQEASGEESVSVDTASDEPAEEPKTDASNAEEPTDTSAAEEPAQPQSPPLPDGEYILMVYSDQLYPADEGVYADVDVHQYVTLDKEVLWDVEVGDTVDLAQFNAGVATVTNVYKGVATFADGTTENERIVAIELSDEPFVNLGSFIYRESFGCWKGNEAADGGYATYDMGISTRVLFPPTTGITDKFSYWYGGKCEPGTVHADIRDFFRTA